MTRLSVRRWAPVVLLTILALLVPVLPRLGGPLRVCLEEGALQAQTTPIPQDTLRVQVGSRTSPDLPVLTRSIQVVGRAEIEALPVRTLSGLLDWATGVEVMLRSPAQSDLSVRGAGFEQVLVMVDGVRMSDPQTGHFDLDLAVPLDQVKRVEILRGPASALYGADAVGGVVNVVTPAGAGGWKGRVEVGSWATTRIAGSGDWGAPDASTLWVGAEVARSDGHRPGTDFETALVHVGAGRPLGPGRVTADLGVARRDFGAGDFYAPYPSFEKTRSYDGSLRWVDTGEGPFRLEATTSLRRHDDDFVLKREDPDFYRNQHTSTQGGGELLAHLDGPGGVRLAVGGELFREVLSSSSLGDRGESRGALMAEAVMGGRGPGILSLGLREDWHQGFGRFLSPSLSGSWRAGAEVRLRGALGRSFRGPTWTERYYRDPMNVGRADLDPERAWSGEIGVDLARGAGASLSATAFVRRAEDLIDWARPLDADATVPWETRNVRSATFRGVEGDGRLRGPAGTSWSLGAILLSVHAADSAGYRSKYALRPQVQRFTVGVDRALSSGFDLGLRAQRGKRSGEASYHRFDLRGSLRVGRGRLYLDATNLTGASYPDITGANAPGRAVFLGLEVSPSL